MATPRDALRCLYWLIFLYALASAIDTPSRRFFAIASCRYATPHFAYAYNTFFRHSFSADAASFRCFDAMMFSLSPLL